MEIKLEDINNKLLHDALSLNPDKTVEEIIGEALKLLVQVKRHGNFKMLKGKPKWVGDLEEMRTNN